MTPAAFSVQAESASRAARHAAYNNKILFVLLFCLALAAPDLPPLNILLSPACAAEQTVPRAARANRALLVRFSRAFWGLDAPIATFAAQIHAESHWKNAAVSSAGAEGMAQFMPATGRWIAKTYPHLGEAAPFNPAWSLKALITYNRHLWDRVEAVDACNRMAKALSAYNGGLGWLRRDEKLARQKGLDEKLWFGSLETVNAGRSASARRENREYPRKILLILEPIYMGAGFAGGMCHE